MIVVTVAVTAYGLDIEADIAIEEGAYAIGKIPR